MPDQTRPVPAPDDVRSNPLIPLQTRLGPVHIAVTEAGPALAVWRDVVGLEVMAETPAAIALGAGGEVLIVLEPGAGSRVAPRTTGLYHVALHVPERTDLAQFVLRALNARIEIAPTDHLVTEAVYLWDPDGNGIEMTFETPWRGRLAMDGSGNYAVTADGRPHSGREALDLRDLFAGRPVDTLPVPRLPAGTRIGHVHVHVTDLDRAMAFYRDVIGFGGLMMLRAWGLADVGLDYMPHSIAFNIWAGANARPAPAGSAGLRHFTIVLPDSANRDAIEARLAAAGSPADRSGDILETADPFGNRIRIVAQA